MGTEKKHIPWYEGKHQEALLYLMIAIFFLELIIGGIAFFYGIMHAAPEAPGGPPVARFPWLAWALAAALGPVGLLLIAHLMGTWVSGVITRDEKLEGADSPAPDSGTPSDGDISPAMRRFYATVRHAPTVVVLGALLLAGAALFFVDGALATLGKFGSALIPYIPWLAGSIAALLAICFLAHAILVYRQRKMENEYAWRREVLQKTGLVVVDKNSVALPQSTSQTMLVAGGDDQPAILDVPAKALGSGQDEEPDPEKPRE